MPRKRLRLIAVIVVLLLLLGGLVAAYFNYRSTRTFFDIGINQATFLPQPQFLYSFNGAAPDQLVAPVGVLVRDGRVYVTDSRRGVVDVYSPEGNRSAIWGKGTLETPLYIAKNPQGGDFYVSDRRKRTIFIFDSAGAVKGEFKPNLPKDQLPAFETGGVVWQPIGIAFADDGTMYVSDTLKTHRVLVFRPDGKFKKSFGTQGETADSTIGEGAFSFPNSLRVIGDEVWVADSNNRRLQVFNREGEFQRIVVTQGLPRGFDELPKIADDEPRRIVVMDTLAHDGTIWDIDNNSKVLTFGTKGVTGGTFQFPHDVSIDGRRRIFVADNQNARIQVWGWPAQANPVAGPTTPAGWVACLSPLLLLPLLLFLRRRRHFATRDFVFALHEARELDRLTQRRVRWEVTEADYEALRDLTQNGVSLAELLHPTEYSESDVNSLMERYEATREQAIALSIAQRAKLFGTESGELRQMARVLEIEVVNHSEFIERTGMPKSRVTSRPGDE